MLGYGEWAWFLAAFPYGLGVSLAVAWAFFFWISKEELSSPLRSLCWGIVILNLAVVLHTAWFGMVRAFEWQIPMIYTIAILMPLKVAIVIASYLHLHALLIIRHQISYKTRKWLMWTGIALIPYPLLVVLLY